jgi:hypothetical protein
VTKSAASATSRKDLEAIDPLLDHDHPVKETLQVEVVSM